MKITSFPAKLGLLHAWRIPQRSGNCSIVSIWLDGEYRFTYEQWHAILDEAKYILNTPAFDELFDYVVGWNIRNRPGRNDMLILMNSSGAEYWNNKDRHRIQLEDVMNWTSLVMNADDNMNIYGF